MTTILLVEDNPILLETIAFELEMHQYKVLVSEDGNHALTLLNTLQDPPDLIISDIAMPDMDGYQLLERVRANEDWHAIPFIFLTAFSSPNAMAIGKELGADDYIVKPFQPKDLIAVIENKLKAR